jgi:hypothetical protein
MRFLIICFLFSLTLSGQVDQKLPSKYVWAESGLTLRAEGKKGGEKLLVIPFGAEVVLTGAVGERDNVLALPSVSYEWDGEAIKSEPYNMKGYYVGVEYDGQQGFVYSSYLSHFPTDGPVRTNPDWHSWINKIGGKVDTLYFNCMLPECGRSESRFLYANGIMQTDRVTEGGGTSVFTFPIGSMDDGFLLGCRFFGFSYSIDHLEEVLQRGEYQPSFLSMLEDGTLAMGDDMCEVHVQHIGGMLVISTGCWC